MSSTIPTSFSWQYGDNSLTKVFVGGLAWETQREAMKKYFDQFGEILEAVIITDKNNGRSKGYGFVTFREPEAATSACADPSPVIDGRRANCNLASLGVQKTRPNTPQHGGNRSFRAVKPFVAGIQGGMGAAAAFPPPATFPHYAFQQGCPCCVYGYFPCSTDCTHPLSYYNVYGGAAGQYPVYGGANGLVTGGTTAFYPYFQFSQTQSGSALLPYSHGMQYPQMLQYSSAGVAGLAAQQYGAHMNPPTQTGSTMPLPGPTLIPYRLIPTHFAAPTAPEKPLV